MTSGAFRLSTAAICVVYFLRWNGIIAVRKRGLSMRTWPFLITIGILAACNETVPDSDNEAVATPADGAAITTSENRDPGASGATPATTGVAAEAALVAGDAAPGARSVEAAHAAGVTNLPLKRGFYVASATSCGQASNATLTLVRGGGINTSRVPCEFTAIEQVGATSYRVTEQCSSGGAAWGTEEEVHTQILVYEIPNETSFTSRSDDGGSYSARFCAQASLPEPWRSNDISGIAD